MIRLLINGWWEAAEEEGRHAYDSYKIVRLFLLLHCQMTQEEACIGKEKN